MRKNYLPGWGKVVWQKNKPFLLFILSLLIILSILKIVFYNYNYSFIFNAADGINTWKDKLGMIKWSLCNDLFIILLVNTALLMFLQLGRFVSAKISAYFILPVFVVVNSFVILLNFADIFYFPFHFQRANADLLFVLDHPFRQLFRQGIFIIAGFFLVIGLVVFVVGKLLQQFYSAFSSGKSCGLATAIMVIAIAGLSFYKNSLAKMMLPAYPLVELNSKQLLIVQNSFQTFAYSLYRGGQEVNTRNYMTVAQCDAVFPIKKTLAYSNKDTARKNIVLFIMESVPYDFFDPESPYKVAMPFFDSLLEKSTFFKNAFCYAHQSNKGITAILAGIPTLPDIPLYHSSFINMPVTRVGNALKANQYHSFFCIGDDHDNFGFAKCANWLGIDNYYSKEDIPGYKDMPLHTMGIQDEYVLDFVHQKINSTALPFFAIHYNISTHYPYDLPKGFTRPFPPGYTNPMKSMSYYDHSLQKFFSAIKNEPWFSNTIFIFCSDHWLVPDESRTKFNAISGYRIPIIIYDPSVSEKKVNTQIVSQFDVMGTILSISGYKDSIISYGGNLLNNSSLNEVVFSRANSSLYQVTDSNYVLGFNGSNDKVEFLYNYKTDAALQNNLLFYPDAIPVLEKMTLKIKAFLQKAAMQYNRAPFK